jgi:hypothetical protein
MNKLELIQKIKVELAKAKPAIYENDFASYPWDKCIADQTKAYGDKATAEAVCGKIKSENQSKQEFKIPAPNSGESQNDYVSRCMKVIGSENKPQDQLVAICIATYENK